MTHRTLVLLRHAKSDYPPGVRDHDRPLAPRGRREAPLAGEWIRSHVGGIDLVLCSTATRTRETLTAAQIAAPVEYLDNLYASSHLDYLAVLREYGGSAATVLLVGHEPSISATALELTANRTSKPAREIEQKYPTASVAVLHTKQQWPELETGHCELIDFHVPR